ncbi:hypothetical protein [Pseudomonas orientalis]|uniref:Uncharacterized protein n=1 Tax=Pseudomonas orientalis TaxID=76758 RepID=A0A1H2H9C9_9PSED|nr:hypothetical protein [Pseudomonas orientalis]KRP61123.1 hypothetical protein TU82_24980 [Pseudomonas orientalis]SDU28349.1 hypothetical protein SAMN04490197_4533 [Pseudomonas orientalis]
MNAIGNYPSANPYYSNQATGSSGAGGAGQAENNFDQGEKINDYTTKKQLEAKLISGINQAAKGFQ